MCQFVWEGMADISGTKKVIHGVTLGIRKRKNNAISIYIALDVKSLVRNKSLTSEEHRTKN